MTNRNTTSAAGLPTRDRLAAEAARLFGTYKLAGGVIKPENVYTAEINNFTFLRLWFGGGELETYAVYKNGTVKLVDQLSIDLKRYGTPRIDQHKIPIAATGRVAPSSMGAKAKKGIPPTVTDTTAASQRIETHPPPGKKKARAGRGH